MSDLFTPAPAVADLVVADLEWPAFRPQNAVRAIVQAATSEARLALLARVPWRWQPMILHFVIVQLAGQVFEAPDPKAVAAQIPPAWLPEVRAHYARYAAATRARAERAAEEAAR